MILLRKVSLKRFILSLFIVSCLTGLSYLSALGSGKGALVYLFYIFRFPTHTLLEEYFQKSSSLYRKGLFINVIFWSIILERLLTIIVAIKHKK